MAYNDNSGTLTKSAVWTERTNSRGQPSKYFSFTFSVGSKMYTCRVYAASSYKPTSGKNQGKECCPVRITEWTKTQNNFQKGGFR